MGTIQRVLALSVLLLFAFCSAAQEGGPDDKTPEVHAGRYAYGGIGPAIPAGAYGKERSVGFDLNTAMEQRFVSGFLLRLMFDFSSFNFDRGVISQESNGEVYAISGSNNLVSLLASGGYYFNAGRFSPYAFAGAGASFVSKPTIEIDETNNYIDTGLLVKSYFSTVAGAGIDFTLFPAKQAKNGDMKSPFIVYIESFYTYIPKTTETSTHKFQLITFNIGIKNKL